jgi:7-cyano-7-deazaguanine synthase
MDPSNIDISEPVPFPNRTVIICSGGLDSTTLLYRLVHEKRDVYALSYNYGQKHKKELECVKKTCQTLKVPHKIVDLTQLSSLGFFGDSSLTSETVVPEGNYTDISMKSTVVPNRNMIMLSMALAYAISIGAGSVFYGAHSGDHAIYPDCRPIFVERMKAVAEVCHYFPVKIEVPYLYKSKADILREGLQLHVNYADTWTCYKGGKKPCGKCGSCVERLEAFTLNNTKDPLEYE